MLKTIVRYKIDYLFFIIGVSLAIVGSFFSISIYVSENKENISYNKNKYKSEFSFKTKKSELSFILEKAKEWDCNVKITNAYVYIDDYKSTIPALIIINSQSEKIPISGNKFSFSTNNKREVILGKGYYSNIKNEGDQKKLNVFDESYDIIGFIDDKSDLYDYSVVFNYYGLGNGLLNNIPEIINIKLESDTIDTKDLYNKKIQPFIVGEISEDDTFYYQSKPIQNEDVFCVLIYLSSFVLISLTLKNLINQRLFEFRLCRAFGYSNKRILFRFFGDMWFLFFITLIISSVIIIILTIIFHNLFYDNGIIFSIETYIIMGLLMIAGMFIACIRPIIILYKKRVI